MPGIKRTLVILFVLTLGAFAWVWIQFMNEGKELDKSGLKLYPLRVLAYPTFVSTFGPGPELAKQFEERCKCKVELLNAGDSALLIEKVLARGGEYSVDLVVGLDQLLVSDALEKIEWREFEIDQVEIDSKLKIEGQSFLWPFDWAPLTFMYKKSEIAPPQTLKELLDPRFKGAVSLQNPITSTPGRQFFSWVYESMGEDEGLKFFEALASQNFTFADTWTNSYGLFQKGPMKMSFTYLTSAIYHWESEKNEDFQPVIFEEPVPVQVEYMGVPKKCRMCEEAEDFARFLLEPGSQSLIMQKNFMYPVLSDVKQGSVFERLPELSVLPVKSEMTNEWLKKALDKVSR